MDGKRESGLAGKQYFKIHKGCTRIILTISCGSMLILNPYYFYSFNCFSGKAYFPEATWRKPTYLSPFSGNNLNKRDPSFTEYWESAFVNDSVEVKYKLMDVETGARSVKRNEIRNVIQRLGTCLFSRI